MDVDMIINHISREMNKNNVSVDFKIEKETLSEFEQMARIGFLNWEIVNNINEFEKYTILLATCCTKKNRRHFIVGYILIEEKEEDWTYKFLYGEGIRKCFTTRSTEELIDKMKEKVSLIEKEIKNNEEEELKEQEELERIKEKEEKEKKRKQITITIWFLIISGIVSLMVGNVLYVKEKKKTLFNNCMKTYKKDYIKNQGTFTLIQEKRLNQNLEKIDINGSYSSAFNFGSGKINTTYINKIYQPTKFEKDEEWINKCRMQKQIKEQVDLILKTTKEK